MTKRLMGIQQVIAIITMFTVGSFSSLLTGAAMAQTMPNLAGELAARGAVTLNGLPASSGATVFTGNNVRTGGKAAATINLGRLGQIELSEDTEMVLKLDNGVIGGELRTGRLIVSAPAGVGVNILTAEGVAHADGKEAAVLTVDVACGNTRVASSKSDAKVTSGDRVEVVSAGQEVAVGSQNPADASRCARMAATAQRVNPALTGGALAALILLGLGGALAGIIASSQNAGGSSSGIIGTLSNFRP